MATHEIEGGPLLVPASHIPANSSLPLRRKSFSKQNASSPTLSENNDDEERMARRREINVTATSAKNTTTNARRHSFGLGFLAHVPAPEITDRISECIKLSAENKINIKNAFSLDIIDFMTYMIKKEDSNMSNLQVASTSLDVSSKIYGYRVDGVHTELMKMVAGSIDKHGDEIETDDQQKDMNATQGNQVNGLEKQGKKRKKKSRQQIFGTVSGLKGTVETAKPLFWMMEDGDSQTTDALYQVMLPNHANSRFYLHLYNDVIVDTVEQNADMKNTEVSIPGIGELSGLEMCPPLANFEFHGWSSDDKNEEDQQPQPEETNENRFQFDLNASLPSEDETVHADMNYLDEPPEAGAEVACAEARKPMEKIVDFCKIVTDTGAATVSEYSFLQKSTKMHWAGPSHWKISNCKRLFGESKVVETCHQEPAKKRKEIEIIYDEDRREAIIPKFALSKATRSEAKTAKAEWQEETLTLPRDMHYTITYASKLYLHKLLKVRLENKDQLNVTDMADGIKDYNYNNENDTSDYCPNVHTDDYGANEDDNDHEADGFEDGGPGTHMIFTGDNLVSVPKLTNKICIAYSVRAKRIDMRQLKKSIWKSLISNGNKEDLNIQVAVEQVMQNEMNGTKCFSEIYKALPDTLTKANVEALSFPISFVSLLHLANEKTLKLETFPDMSDIIIATN